MLQLHLSAVIPLFLMPIIFRFRLLLVAYLAYSQPQLNQIHTWFVLKFMPFNVMSCNVISGHVMSCYVMSCRDMSCHVMSCQVMLI